MYRILFYEYYIIYILIYKFGKTLANSSNLTYQGLN